MTTTSPSRVSAPLPGALASTILNGPAQGTLQMEGDIPPWLTGHLIRACAGVFELGDWSASHWADGLGLLVRFDLVPGMPIRWRQALLDCEFASDARHGISPLASFATPSQRSFWERLRSPIPTPTDNANVHIRPGDGHWIAMTETNRHLCIDPVDLRSLGEQQFEDRLPARLFMSAHPIRDPDSGDLVNFGLAYGPRTRLIVFRQAPGSQCRVPIGQVSLPRAPYVHSFAMTRTRIILVLPPFDLQPVWLLGSRRPVADHFRWRPENGTRIVVMDRATGEYRTYHGPAFFLLHTVNARDDDDGSILLELLSYPDARIMAEDMRLDAIRRAGLPPVQAQLQRIRLAPGVTSFSPAPVAPGALLEFPAIHAARCTGRPHRYVWGSDLHHPVKIDSAFGSAVTGQRTGLVIGEPVFVARPGGTAEDDGALLTVASSPSGGGSELIVWDAASLSILCRGRTSQAFPLGFHGSFVAGT